MKWQQLISSARWGKQNTQRSATEQRTEFQRDYDRLIFSSPFRRLQNKTQVFPLPGSVFVHNRLTHSLEVSSVGRSLGADVARLLIPRYSGEDVVALESISAIVSAACLAHDLGNPPSDTKEKPPSVPSLLRERDFIFANNSPSKCGTTSPISMVMPTPSAFSLTNSTAAAQEDLS